MDLQDQFFSEIRKKLPSNKALVDTLCSELNISQDSAYRRLRGETAITLPEIKRLGNKFNVSLDDIIYAGQDSVHFQYKWIEPEDFRYTDYLKSLQADIQQLALFDDNEILFIAKDLPIFCNFLVPEIAEFKGFFWQKTAIKLDSYRKKKFDVENLNKGNLRLGYELVKSYNLIPTTELWHPDVINSFLSQITYYYESGFFADDSMAYTMFDKLEELINHFESQAEHNSKFLIGKEPSNLNNYKLYKNDVNIGDNTLCLRTNNVKTVYFTHNVINNIITQNEKFCDQTWSVHMNMIKRSTFLGQDSPKERNKFFRSLKARINRARNLLEDYSMNL